MSREFIWETMKKYRTWIVVTATPLGTLVVWVNFVTSLSLYPDWSRTYFIAQAGHELMVILLPSPNWM